MKTEIESKKWTKETEEEMIVSDSLEDSYVPVGVGFPGCYRATPSLVLFVLSLSQPG